MVECVLPVLTPEFRALVQSVELLEVPRFFVRLIPVVGRAPFLMRVDCSEMDALMDGHIGKFPLEPAGGHGYGGARVMLVCSKLIGTAESLLESEGLRVIAPQDQSVADHKTLRDDKTLRFESLTSSRMYDPTLLVK